MKCLRNTLMGTVLLLFCTPGFAQVAPYVPLENNAAGEMALLKSTVSRYEKDVEGLKGSNKKHLAAIYKERLEMIREKYTRGEIITDPKAVSYLNSLAQQVGRANPSVNLSELRILFSKAWWPNASSMGEGTILFNIGLFSRLRSEAQAVFVLCHELSHYYLNHGNNNILRYVNTVHSEAFQKELKAIKSSEYRQNQQAEALAKSITFHSRRHGREHEHAADSMAIALMKNTPYDLTEALSCLALLDSVDRDKYDTELKLEKRFDFSAFRFRKRWLQSGALMFSITRETAAGEADSLKTHPDCAARIDKLKEAAGKGNRKEASRFIVGEQEFFRLQQQFDFEILNYCFQSKWVSRCLYFTLQMLDFYPDNVYLHTTVGRCLNELYSRQKAHELDKVVDLPGPDKKEPYNNLLHMIQNLRLPEMAALSYYYLRTYQSRFEGDRPFTEVWNRSRQNFGNPSH